MNNAMHSNSLQAPSTTQNDPVAEVAKKLLQVISNHLLDHPEKISIEVIPRTSEVMVQLQVPRDEVGKMIGKHGRMADSIRCLLAALTEKTGTRFTLDIVEQHQEAKSIPPLQERMKL